MRLCNPCLARFSCVVALVGWIITGGMARADCFPVPARLIGWWPGDGSANNIFGTNHAQLQGGALALAVGKVGQAFSFDGTNGHALVPNSPLLQPTNLTIECWVRFAALDSPGTASAGLQYLVFKQNTRTTSFEGFDLGKSRVGGNDVFRFIVSSASGQSVSIQSTSTVTAGVWYHVAAVRGSNYTQLYVNGVLERQATVSFPLNYGNFPLYFGTSGQAYWDRKLNGDLDEVSLYDRALSPAEIAAIYAAGFAGKCKAGGSPSEILINVDFDGATQSAKTGPAAIGQSLSDFWNAYEGAGNWRTDGTLAFLKSANGSNTQVGLSVPNTPGSWGNYSSDPMYNGYIYPEPPAGITITVTNLPPANYSFYLYSSDGNFQLTSGGANYGNKTSLDNPVVSPPVWEEGRQYVVYQNVVVTNFTQAVTVAVQPGVFGYSIVSGMQIMANLQPWFVLQPTNTTLLEGSELILRASAFGFSSADHRWYFNGLPLVGDGRVSGVASNTLSILSVTTNDAGSYWCVASNAAGAVTSAVAVVTVNTCVAPSGLVAWWKWEGDALDSASTNNGTALNGATFGSGKVGSALSLDGINDHVRIADSSGLLLTNAMTVEAWIYPTAISGFHSIVSKWDAVVGPNQRSYSLGLNPDGRASFGVSADGSVTATSTATINALPVNVWTHVAATYDGASLRIYTNGVLNNQTPYSQGIFPGTADLGIGANVGGTAAGDVSSPFVALFKGLMDEVAIYNRALSGGEIEGIVAASSLGKCPPPLAFVQQPQSQTRGEALSVAFAGTAIGAPPIGYQWYFNGSPVSNGGRVSGANTARLVITNLQTNDAGNYWLVASDVSGSVTSQVATLTVSPAACSPPIGGLVAWWTGDSQAFDSVGTNHGTLTGNLMYGTGRVGQSFVLDGNGDGVLLGNPASLELQDFSIEVWIKRADPTLATSGSQSSALFFGYGHGGYGLGILNNGRLFLTRVGIDNVTLNAPVIADTNYHHVAVTKAGSTVFFYVDGVAYPVPIYNTTYSFDTAAAIGIRSDTLDAGFLGSIDDVAVYNRALSLVEVESIYSAGALGKCSPPLAFVQQPQSQTKFEQQSVRFTASAIGSLPIGYQWYFNGTPLGDDLRRSGSTNLSLAINHLDTNDSGSYWVVVSNLTGMATSVVATLSVNPPACAPPVSGLVSWWTGDGQPIDSANTNHGVLSNGLAFAAGKVGSAFSFDGTNDLFKVAASELLNVGVSNGLTIECWVKPADISAPRALVEWNDPSQPVPFGAHLWISYAGGPGCLFANLFDTSGNNRQFATGPGIVATNAFVHVALTYDQTTGWATLYSNGVVAAAQNLGVFTPQTARPLYLGHRPTDGGNYYKGLIDEVGIYNRVLSAAELQAIYDAGALGKCHQPIAFIQQPQSQAKVELSRAVFASTAIGAPPITYQWYFNGTSVADDGRISGATNSSLTLANLQTNDAGNYWVVASNTTGAVTSSVALLAVSPPVCTPAAGGLLDWWAGDNHAYDYAATNHQTLVNGTAFAPGMVGMAFSFDGLNDYATNAVPKLTSVANSTYTIEFWARPAATRTTTTESTVGLAGISNQRYAIFPDPGNTTMAGSGVSVGVNGVSVFEHGNTYLPSLLVYDTPITNWTHIAVVYQARQPRLYLNGVLVRVGQTSSRTSYPSTSLGERGQGYGYYAGLLDEVSIYNRALSDIEIADLYSSQFLGKCPPPPKFIQPLAGGSFPLGGQIVLSATVAGSWPMSYQWYYTNAVLTDGGRIQGATTNRLVISGAQFADAGNYFVVVSNAVGTVTSAVAAVEVYNAPYIIQQPANQSGVVGGTAQFTAQAGGDEPFTYRWYQNSTALSDGARHFGTTTTNLVITNLIAGDAGNYTLRVTNAFGSVTSTVATLTVFTPPSITTQPRGYSVPIGLPVTLSGAASGTAPLQYAWLLNGVPVSNASASSLAISNLSLNQFGNYQLVASNYAGAVTSSVAPLTVGTVGIWGSYSQAANVPVWPAAGLSNVVGIAAGNGYSLALRQNGTVYAWGINSAGTNLPSGPFPLVGVVSIAAGPDHALALLSNGLVRAWGSSSSGKTTVPLSLSNVIAVAAGSFHSAALRSDGTVVVWGGSSVDGQTNIPPGLMKVVAIDAGDVQTLALQADGRLVNWGGRVQLPLGLPPYPVPYDLKDVAGFAAGPSTTLLNLAVSSNGLVRAWGASSLATNVPTNLSGIIAVETATLGDLRTGIGFALRSNRTVVGWGSVSPTSLTNVPAGLSNVLTLAGGAGHVVALVDDGRPLIIRPPVGGTFYSGRDLVLQAKVVGNGPLSFQWFKDSVPIPGGNDESLVLPFAQLADAGSYHLVAENALGVAQSVTVPVTIVDRAPVLMSQPRGRFAYYGSPFSVGASLIGSGPMELLWLQDGTLAHSGTNDLVFDRALPPHGGSYQLIASNPFGSVTSSVAQVRFSRMAAWGGMPAFTNIPVEVDLGNLRGAAAGGFHALVIRSNGTVAAWGTLSYGTTNVPAGLTDVVAVTAGNDFSVALKADGTVVAWGLNSIGQANVPSGLSNVISISAGASHALALRTDGTVVAWGQNASGQTNVPAGLSNVVAIAAGSVHSLALQSNGKVVGWGTFGIIPTYKDIVAIAAGLGQSLALQADGTIRAWNTSGSTSAPPPPGLSNIVAISAGVGVYGSAYHGVALKQDGSVTVWGNNNSFAQHNVPPELASAIAISAGGSGTLAMLNDRSPHVTTELFDRHAVSGSSVKLAALSVGQPALNFQWRLNGVDIPGAISPTLTLTNVSRNSRGLYSAFVWNALGVTNSREAWLDVIGPVKLLPSAGGGSDQSVSFVASDATGQSLAAADAAWLEAQASTNLVNWQTLSNSLVFTNGTLLLQDSEQTNYPARYYRIIEH